MRRLARFLQIAYAVAAYALFLATMLAAIAFVLDLGLPWSVDAPAAGGSAIAAVAADHALVLGFGLQHSAMARPAFKRAWLRVVRAPVERATYVLASSLALGLVIVAWRPLPGALWDVRGTQAGAALLAAGAGGWLLLVAASFLVSHWELFGLAQAWRGVGELDAGAGGAPPELSERGLYRVVRHPIMLGFLVAFWCAPRMTAGHLLFASACTAYIAAGTRLEERDLLARFGVAYARYRERVPMLLPRPWRRRVRTSRAASR
jgi:protein-S-isoprenylcysteine O-methyltransferase Ste14